MTKQTPTLVFATNAHAPIIRSFLSIPASPHSPLSPISPSTQQPHHHASLPAAPAPLQLKPDNENLAHNAAVSAPPPEPMPWYWQCHMCARPYRYGTTIRCIEDGHRVCFGVPNMEKKFSHGRSRAKPRKSKKRSKQSCNSLFDYTGWQSHGDWRRELVHAGQPAAGNGTRDCFLHCDFPSACRSEERVAATTAAAQEKATSPGKAATSFDEILNMIGGAGEARDDSPLCAAAKDDDASSDKDAFPRSLLPGLTLLGNASSAVTSDDQDDGDISTVNPLFYARTYDYDDEFESGTAGSEISDGVKTVSSRDVVEFGDIADAEIFFDADGEQQSECEAPDTGSSDSESSDREVNSPPPLKRRKGSLVEADGPTRPVRSGSVQRALSKARSVVRSLELLRGEREGDS